jgi:hypothetical protein
VDLGIAQPGVIIDRGVDEPMTVQRVAVAAGPAAGAVGLAVTGPSGPAQEPVATTGRDVAQLLDIEVDQVAGMVVFVAAHRPAGGPVQIGQAADAAADQDGMHGRGSQANLGGDLGRPKSLLPA